MKKNYMLLLLFAPLLMSRSQTAQQKVEEKKETLSTIIADTKQKQDEIKERLESIEVVLPESKSRSRLRTEIRKYVRTEVKIIYDTIYLPCDTLTIVTKPSGVFGGDSVQKAQWKPKPDEGKFFKGLFKKRQ